MHPKDPEALKTEFARLRYELATLRLLMIERKYSPDQPRVPAGNGVESGRWAKTDAGRIGMRGLFPAQSYRLKDRSVVVSPAVDAKLTLLGSDFYRDTGKTLVVTSGTRDAEDQAAAMFNTFQHGSDGALYTHKNALEDIKAAYNDGMKRGLSTDETINNMTAVIKSQQEKGNLISLHMTGRGADIKTKGELNSVERATLIRLSRNHGFHVVPEKKPPHVHLELHH